MLAALAVQFVTLINTMLSIIIGFFLGHMLYNFTVKIIPMDPQNLYYLTVLVCVIIVYLFSFIIETLIIVVATSLIGAYCAVRGLSIVLGGFPAESYLSKLLAYKEYNQVARIFGGPAFVYLISIVLLFFVGLISQAGISVCCGSNEKDKENEKPNSDNKDNIEKENDKNNQNNEEKKLKIKN